LARKAAKRGILIEPDSHYYAGTRESRNCFRMGVTSIPRTRIREGVELLRDLIREQESGQSEILNENDPDWLRGEDLKRLMSSSTWIYKTVYGDPCSFELHADGSMSGVAGHANEEHDRGQWWIDGDFYCRQWQEWAYGEKGRYYITLKGQYLRLYNADKRFVDSAIIHPHQG